MNAPRVLKYEHFTRAGRPPVDKTQAQCRVSGSRGGKIAAFGRDRARRKDVPVTLAGKRIEGAR